MKVLILIPCFNEEKNIDYVIENIKNCNADVDYIIINDCSTDKTLCKCLDKGYNFLSLPVNLGIGGCMQTGYRYAYENGYDIAIQHDGDGQHDPCYFDSVIAPIESGQADIVIGSRFLDAKKGFQSTGMRRAGISFLSGLIRICSGVKVYDVTSGYRAVNRQFIEMFAERYAQDYPEPESIIDAVLSGAKVMEIPVIMHERKEGKSTINALKPLYYMIKVSIYILLHRFITPRGTGR